MDNSTQGQIQGALYGIKSLAAALGPLLFSFVFRSFDGDHYGFPSFVQAPMLLGAALEGTAALVALTVPESGRAEDMMTPRPGRGNSAGKSHGYASIEDEFDAGGSPGGVPDAPALRRLRTLPGPDSPAAVDGKVGASV